MMPSIELRLQTMVKAMADVILPAIAPENADGHLTMAALHTGHGDHAQGLAHLDTLQAW